MGWMSEQLEGVEREARRKGLSMRRACRLAGIPQATVSRWKSGTHAPRMALFERLKHAVDSYAVKQS